MNTICHDGIQWDVYESSLHIDVYAIKNCWRQIAIKLCFTVRINNLVIIIGTVLITLWCLTDESRFLFRDFVYFLLIPFFTMAEFQAIIIAEKQNHVIRVCWKISLRGSKRVVLVLYVLTPRYAGITTCWPALCLGHMCVVPWYAEVIYLWQQAELRSQCADFALYCEYYVLTPWYAAVTTCRPCAILGSLCADRWPGPSFVLDDSSRTDSRT